MRFLPELLEYRVPSSTHTFSCALQRFFRPAFMLLAMLCVAISFPIQAEAAAKRAYAGIVIDAKTGKTLYSHAADATRYPASVTKVMTLYVVFQELKAGNLKLSTRMRVSKHAASAVPTKLGLRSGSTISVSDAIKSLVTLSANDISRVIAEHISGTESQFAVRMTKTARALGMNRTTYKNASGLPNSGQITTARDQARLGVAVYQHFPKYYEYFQTRGFKYGKRTYGNHNRLLGKNGVDGIKTGYIRAAGYNLLTAARKNNRHIVVVGFGFDSGAKRNSKVASLVSKYLPKARRGTYTAQAVIARPGGAGVHLRVAIPVTPMPRLASRMPGNMLASASVPAPPPDTSPVALVASVAPSQAPEQLIVAPSPQQRPVELMPASAVALTPKPANAVQATNLMVASTTSPQPQTRPINIVGAWIDKNLRLGPETGANGNILPPAPIGNAPTAPVPQSAALDLMTSGAANTQEISSWVVQIGAPNNEDSARNLLGSAKAQVKDLENFRPFIETISKNGQTYHRARFAGFGDREQARKFCELLKNKNMNCLAMQG